jgi:predicted dehydrogenase
VTRRLHELLATGEPGQLRHVEVDMVIPAPADDDPRRSLELAGGALMDLDCYGLHAHRMLAAWAGGPARARELRLLPRQPPPIPPGPPRIPPGVPPLCDAHGRFPP